MLMTRRHLQVLNISTTVTVVETDTAVLRAGDAYDLMISYSQTDREQAHCSRLDEHLKLASDKRVRVHFYFGRVCPVTGRGPAW